MTKDIKTFKDLKVWQKGFDLCKTIYVLSREFPRDERFGLTAELRKTARSVPCNIAEGYCRRSRREYIRFLNISAGSLGELETQVLLSIDLEYAHSEDATALLEAVAEVDRMLSALIRSLN